MTSELRFLYDDGKDKVILRIDLDNFKDEHYTFLAKYVKRLHKNLKHPIRRQVIIRRAKRNEKLITI